MMDLTHLRPRISREKLKAARMKLGAEIAVLNREHKTLQRELSKLSPIGGTSTAYTPVWHKIILNRTTFKQKRSKVQALEKFHRAVFKGHKQWLDRNWVKRMAEEFAICPLEELARAADGAGG